MAAAIITTICNSIVNVVGLLYPSHVKDFIHKLSCKTFDSTVVYTDKNVELEGLKTSSTVSPDILKNATEYSSYDQSFKADSTKASQEEVTPR